MPSVSEHISSVAAECTECMVCVRQCAFLTTRGTPKSLAAAAAPTPDAAQTLAYECSLCGLCTRVCPFGVDPCSLFLELRRETAKAGALNLQRYRTILGYERRGRSPLFRHYGLPPGCDTVLFPGCNMPGSRPGVVWDLFRTLQRHIPNLGVVLDCCSKPSHDLGREEYFSAQFGDVLRRLQSRGVSRVLVTCPNCHKVFSQYGEGLETRTVYTALHELGCAPPPPGEAPGFGPAVIHDPCPLRHETAVQDAVRALAVSAGVAIEEMRHSREMTVCCGEGGAVGFNRPDFAKAWTSLRATEARGRPLLTYCAGCAGFLSRSAPTTHILDLLFRPAATLAGRARIIKPPFTYAARLRLKRRFRRAASLITRR